MIFWCFVGSFLARMKLDLVSWILLPASKKFPARKKKVVSAKENTSEQKKERKRNEKKKEKKIEDLFSFFFLFKKNKAVSYVY